jgi:putative tricarboxylic transport membrane protein
LGKSALAPSLKTRRIAASDFAGGLFFIAVAALGLWLLRDVRLGTSMRMGPGYLPTAVCYLLLLIGLWTIGKSFVTGEGAPLEHWYVRPLIFVLGAVFVFAIGIEKLGLFLGIVVLVMIAALATPESRWKEVLVAALLLGGFSTALFIAALGLPLSPWPQLAVF